MTRGWTPIPNHPIPALEDGDFLKGSPPGLWGIVPTPTAVGSRVFVCDGGNELRQGMPVTVIVAYDQPTARDSPCAGAKP